MRALVITSSITPREQKSVERYLQELSRYEVLTPEEEVALFNSYRGGDEDAFSKIVSHNLRFVVSVSKKYQNMGLGLADLINEGNVGLIKAAQRFDISKGFKFISYAVWWIRQSILQALNNKGRKIRVPLNVKASMSKVRAQMIEIGQREEREPTVEELADATGLKQQEVRKCMKHYDKCQSLDRPLGDESFTTLGDVLEDGNIHQPDHQLAVVETQKTDVSRLLGRLKEREATVLSMYYGIDRKRPLRLSDIADQVGVSRERVRQIKDRAISKLRSRSKQFQYAATFSAN